MLDQEERVYVFDPMLDQEERVYMFDPKVPQGGAYLLWTLVVVLLMW